MMRVKDAPFLIALILIGLAIYGFVKGHIGEGFIFLLLTALLGGVVYLWGRLRK
jgi:hypothetical protein